MASRAYGRMVFWEGASLWILGKRPGDAPYPKTAFHAHHAVQVTLALRGSFTLDGRDHRISGTAAAVAPDVEHAFAAEELIAHLFIDPEGRPGRELQRALFADHGIVAIAAERLGELPARMLAGFDARRRTDASLIELGRTLVARLAPGSERDDRPEVRVRRMSAWAAARLESPISLADAARHVSLSSGRAFSDSSHLSRTFRRMFGIAADSLRVM